MTVEPLRRPPSPRWAVCCWIAALHILHARPDSAERYLGELLGMAFAPKDWSRA